MTLENVWKILMITIEGNPMIRLADDVGKDVVAIMIFWVRLL